MKTFIILFDQMSQTIQLIKKVKDVYFILDILIVFFNNCISQSFHGK